MSMRGHRLRIVGLILVVAIPAIVGGLGLAEGGLAAALGVYLFHGTLSLIALWSALSNAPLYVRWPCVFLALWLACPELGPDFAAHLWPHYGWRSLMAWEVVPHVLLTFTLLCVLRELGLRVQRGDGLDGTRGDKHWHFTLRKLFAWVAGAAVLTWAWKNLFAVVLGQAAIVGEITNPPPFPSWRPLADGMISGVSLTALDLIAVWAVLRPGRVRWRIALFVVVAAISQTLIWHYAVRAALGLNLHRDALNADVSRIRVYDQLCLCPMLLALTLVRAGGHRWTASHSLSPQHSR